jgi:WD40 repeat protein
MRNLDIDSEGEFFISCGQDALVKVWHYDDGIPAAVGKGHSGAIAAAKLSPDQSQIVTCGEHGDIIFWDMPPLHQLRDKIDEVMGGHK